MLDKILEYQKIDNELFACESELAKSTDKEKATEIQQVLKNQHSRLLSLENTAKQVNDSYHKACKKYEEFNLKLSELEKQIQTANEKNLALYEKSYEDFLAISVALEKEISNIYNQVQVISKEYEDIIRKSKTDREKFDKFKASYSKLKAEKEPKIAELKAKLVEMAKGIDSSLLNIYRQKRDGHIFPVFVALNVNKCGGCRMEISASKMTEMSKNKFGVIECENCGRYIFKK